jgi:hypothetical protein
MRKTILTHCELNFCLSLHSYSPTDTASRTVERGEVGAAGVVGCGGDAKRAAAAAAADVADDVDAADSFETKFSSCASAATHRRCIISITTFSTSAASENR